MRLGAMNFVLQFDRPIDLTRHCVSPGGYRLNGKTFDFHLSHREKIAEDQLYFNMSEFDHDYSTEDVLPEDLEDEFSEFYVFAGEYYDPEIKPVSVKSLEFILENEEGYGIKTVKASNRTLKSANKALCS